MGYPDPLIALSDVSLIRKNRTELDRLNIQFRSGIVHAILGKYGSGKSLLVSILRGSEKPTGGSLMVLGKRYSHLRIRESMKMGIAVLQHFDQFIDNLRVKEFLYDAHYSHNASIVSRKKMNDYYRHLQEVYGIPDYGELPLSRIPLSDKFFLSIVKQVDMGPKVIILDEILDKLNSTQLSKTISILRERADAGVAIVLITNNIEEVYNIAEDVSILKNGKLIYGDDIRKIEKINLIKLAYIEISKSDSGAVADQAFYQLLKYNEAILYELPINLLIIDREMVVKIANKSARSFFMMDNHVQLDIPVERLFHDNTPIFIAIVKAFDRQEATILHNILLELGENQYRVSIKTNPIFDGPDFIGLIIAIEDVTEQELTRENSS
jgi:ABC-type multidrug transport system ATPase subunit